MFNELFCLSVKFSIGLLLYITVIISSSCQHLGKGGQIAGTIDEKALNSQDIVTLTIKSKIRR